MPEVEEIQSRVCRCLLTLNEHDNHLLEIRAHERSLTDELGYQVGLALVFCQNGQHQSEWIQANQEPITETLG